MFAREVHWFRADSPSEFTSQGASLSGLSPPFKGFLNQKSLPISNSSLNGWKEHGVEARKLVRVEVAVSQTKSVALKLMWWAIQQQVG